MRNDYPSNPKTSARRSRSSKWIMNPLFLGALYGLLMRVLFHKGMPHFNHLLDGPMAAGFIYGVPIAVGAITVWLAERQQRRSYGYYLIAPWGTVLLFEFGTAITLLEGSICILLATPLFLVLGSIGGVLMGTISRLTKRKSFATLNSFAVLPFLIAIAESTSPLPSGVHQVEKYIDIAASPGTVWHNINHANNIQPNEINDSLVYLIGVPKPISGVTKLEGNKFTRESIWGRGVTFDEKITHWEPSTYLRWEYQFSENSFPKGSIDEHVLIGGEYFDLVSTSYSLHPTPDGTQLKITIAYRVSTRFNWYAETIGKILLADFSQTILQFYKTRSEQPIAVRLQP